VLEISPRIPDIGSFLGGDSGPQDQRLQAFQARDFGPEPETLVETMATPIQIFAWVVQASIFGLESLQTRGEDSAAVQIEAGDSGPYSPQTLGGTGDCGPHMLETLGLVDSNG
jgi:hypothetical protein